MTSRKAPERKLQRYWHQVYGWARARSNLVPRLAFFVGCRDIEHHRRTDPRAFFHIGHRRGVVCTVPKAASLPLSHVVGLILHEIGHPMADKAWGCSEQAHADAAVRAFLGVKIVYRGPLVLQAVSARWLHRILLA